MRKVTALVGVILCVAASVAPAEAGTLRNFRVGDWFAGAYSFDGTKRFSHCAASAPYVSGIYLVFSVDRNYQWSVGFFAPQFNVPPKQTIRLGLSIDGEAPQMVSAYALSEKQLNIQLAPNAALFQKFRQGNTLRLIANDVSHTFNLTGTSRVLPALLECVQTTLNPPMQSAQVAKPMQPPSPPADHRAEATALVANLLSQAGISGFQISPGKQEDIGHGADVFWMTDKVSGALLILMDSSLKGPGDTAPRLIELAAKACKGAFMSGSLPNEADGTQARVFTSCRTDNNVRAVYYLTIKRPSGGYYVFVTAANGSEEPAVEADGSIRTAVFKVVPK